MFRFLAEGGASFSYAAELDEEVPYANLSFFDAARRDILFHLSLRGKQNVAVTNTRHEDHWREETPHEVELHEGVVQVEIEIMPPHVLVKLDGQVLIDDDESFPDISDAAFASWQGAIIDDTIEIGGEANEDRRGMGELKLTDSFAVTGWAFDPIRPGTRPGIEVEGLGEPLRVHLSDNMTIARSLNFGNATIGMRATLPGRVWSAGDSGRVTVQAVAGHLLCGEPLIVTHDDIIRTIERNAETLTPEGNAFAALAAIEHVRFGGFYDALTDSARRYLLTAARLYNAVEYLFPEGHPDVADKAEARPRSDKAPGPAEVLTARVQSELNSRLRETPDADAASVLGDLLEEYPLDGAARRTLVLSLVEPVCQTGRHAAMRRLEALIADQKITAADNAWQNSLHLPFLMIRGEIQTAAQMVSSMSSGDGAWFCSPPVAWVLTELATRDNSPWDDRFTDQILRGLTQLVERSASAYWRLPCARMTEAAVVLLSMRDRMPDAISIQVRDFILHCFACSERFWTLVDERVAAGMGLTQTMVGARAAFRIVAAHARGQEDAGDLDMALRHLAALGAIEAPRLRLELMGPAGAGDLDALSEPVMQLSGTGLNLRELSLRAMAFPGNKLDDPGLAEAAHHALRRRWNNVDKAPYYSVQISSSRRLHKLVEALQDAGEGPETTRLLDEVMPHLRKISGQFSGYLGLGLLLTLLGAALRADAPMLADRALARLGQILSDMPKAMRDKSVEAPSVVSALATLDRLAAAPDAPDAARAALSLFPGRPAGALELFPEEPVMAEGWELASPLFDTLVTVFSCKPYLDTRVSAMRDGWLKDLAALGIPYVVVVGDGDGTLDGDLLRLDAPDDYEGLPQKTLATVDWVFSNTTFEYMLKIDDDCFLNVDEYFHSQSYRKFDYYGRGLTRALGQMDRSWHHEKSQSDRARTALDKSPEPSSYADGGGGYTLSRHAMSQLLASRDTIQGWQLIDSSFMEDKVVGDLLSMRGIKVASEDYYTTIWRRTHGKARQIMLWDNYFLPSAASPCKMAHLDTADEQAPTEALRGANTLWPRKIWPSFTNAGLGYDSNQLELLSDEAQLADLNARDLAVICTCRNEIDRLPRFLAHYRKMGVAAFLFVDNASDDGTREYLLDQEDCAVFSADTNYSSARYGVTWQVTLLASLRQNRWSLVADSDELLVYPGWRDTPLEDFVAEHAGEADAFRVQMLDMYPQGPLAEAELGSDPFAVAGFTDADPVRLDPLYRGVFSNDQTRVSAVRHRLIPDSRALTFLAQKYALLRYRPWMRLSEGLHYSAETQVAGQELLFAHFKYDNNFATRITTEVARGRHFNRAEEYRRYAELLSTRGDVLFDESVSVPWQESRLAKTILG